VLRTSASRPAACARSAVRTEAALGAIHPGRAVLEQEPHAEALPHACASRCQIANATTAKASAANAPPRQADPIAAAARSAKAPPAANGRLKLHAASLPVRCEESAHATRWRTRERDEHRRPRDRDERQIAHWHPALRRAARTRAPDKARAAPGRTPPAPAPPQRPSRDGAPRRPVKFVAVTDFARVVRAGVPGRRVDAWHGCPPGRRSPCAAWSAPAHARRGSGAVARRRDRFRRSFRRASGRRSRRPVDVATFSSTLRIDQARPRSAPSTGSTARIAPRDRARSESRRGFGSVTGMTVPSHNFDVFVAVRAAPDLRLRSGGAIRAPPARARHARRAARAEPRDGEEARRPELAQLVPENRSGCAIRSKKPSRVAAIAGFRNARRNCCDSFAPPFPQNSPRHQHRSRPRRVPFAVRAADAQHQIVPAALRPRDGRR
jgi:hypothetical protein